MSEMKPSDHARRHGARFLKFGAVGGVNTAIDFAVYAGLILAGFTPWIGNICSFLTANAASYLMNSRFTFRGPEGPARLSPSGYLKFFSAHAMSLLVSTAIVAVLASPIGPLFAKLAAIGVTVVLNYLASAFFVFKEEKKS